MLNLSSSSFATTVGGKFRLITTIPSLFFVLTLLTSCAAPPKINNSPDLKRFNHFELTLQGGATNSELKTYGSLNFQRNSAAFDVKTAESSNAGYLFVQPDDCRDDPSETCARRFNISGRINVLKTSLNCIIAVRNDTAFEYQDQSLTGLCQDRNSRAYGITIFSK